MAGLPVKIEEFWRSDHEARKYKEWVTALSEKSVDGFHKRRSNSAPAEDSQPLETSKRENAQAALFDCPGKFLHEPSRLSFKLPPKKDVDGCQPKMRETSGSERKRKKHRHSSDFTLPIQSEDVVSPESLEATAALPSNIENEGVATSCKRIKLSTPQIKKYHHNNVFEPISDSGHAALRSVDELGDHSGHLTLDSDPTLVSIDGEAREQETVSGNGNASKKKTSGGSFLARYNGPANNFPDYGPPAAQTAVAVIPGRNMIMAGEKKSSISGSFRPFNTLKSSDNSPSMLTRPSQKKVFDLHENNSTITSDEPRAAKRQKIRTENLVRRESSSSVVEVAGDSHQVVTGRNMSSTSSTPKKTVQSVSSRSHYQNQHYISRLGEVDEYNRTEAIIGFSPERKRKAVLSELERRGSFRGEIESASRQRRISLMSELPVIVNKGTPPDSVKGVGKDPILVEDNEPEEVVLLSEAPKAAYGRARNATPRPAATKVPESANKSQYFAKPDKPSKAKNGAPHAATSRSSSGSTVEAPERGEASSPNSLHSLGNAVEDVQFLEDDGVDLVKHDSGSAKAHQKIESRARVQNSTMKPFASPKSKSISEEGDIPQSTFSRSRPKTNQSQSSRTLKSELSFEITYMQSGQKGFELPNGFEAWKLQYDNENNEFDVIGNGDSFHHLYPGLVLKPEKIHIVKYNHGSLIAVISRAMEGSIGAAGQVLLKMSKPGDGDRLAQSLRKLNRTITLSPTPSEHLEKIFSTARKSASFAHHPPQDIPLLTAKETRLATAQRKAREGTVGSTRITTEEWSQPANVGRRRSSTADQDSSTQTRRQSIANRMLSNSLSDVPSSSRTPAVILPTKNELSSSSRLSTMNREDFYGSRRATRASSGQWTGERQFQPLKSRPSSPVRWTAENPSWKEERSWEASLTFPKESKKKATVDPKDIERLDEGEFLNDNLIAFYLRYLEDCLEKSRPELARRIYFHNTFFYVSLTKGKVRSNNINYDAVKRWTSKVDLFSYDYIVVPVCEKLHWYVAIICNAPKLLQVDIPGILKSQDTEELEMPPEKATIRPTIEESNDHSGASKMLDISNDAAEPRSASPSVVAQVEHMSLEDQEQEWPEPDALPDGSRPRIAQLRNLRPTEELNEDPIVEDGLQNHGQNEDIRPKVKKLKRKSIPHPRKYDPSDPRIITLDSLGQAHSPTCSNLKEYLVCEAKERRNVDIAPGRLGMTAKGIPQQSNYCDCGVFVLGYIQKFLENPDEFIYSILQGDMAENKDSFEVDASQMRAGIRELIFRLQARQIQDEKGRREAKSKAKKVSDPEARPRVSSKLLDSKSPLSNGRSSKAAKTEAEPNECDSTEPAMKYAARSVASKAGNSVTPKTPETRRHSSVAINGHESSPVEEIEPHSIDTFRAERSRTFLKSASSPINRAEDSEIMETPAPSVEDEPNLARKKSVARDEDFLSSPNSADTSIQLDSPLRPAFSEDKWLTSPHRKAEKGCTTQNTFKEFAKSPDSPFQNTRYKTRREKTSDDSPVEISDSQEGHQLEVSETPPKQRERDDSFEDILELLPKPRKSKPFVLDADQSPKPKGLRRNAGADR